MSKNRWLLKMYARMLTILVFFSVPVVCMGQEPSWDSYSRLLKKYVTVEDHDGVSVHWIDYTGLKSDPNLALLTKELSTFPVNQLEGTQERLAFYINTYNILAIETVLMRWPVESIKDVGSFLRPVWKRKIGVLDGQDVSLDEIEHEILRPIGDSRIHMAIVCASISCPDLRQEPYTAKELNEQLDDQAKKFLANKEKGLVIEGFDARSSKIFDWFEEDFVKDFGSVDQFFYTYSDLPQGTKVKYNLPYNWSVNGD